MNSNKDALKNVKAIGNFLVNYYSDLLFIKEFRIRVNGKVALTENYFDKNVSGSFQKFLNGYKISRNFTKGITKDLFYLSKEFILFQCKDQKQNTGNVKLFADYLKERRFTRNNLISLTSKILFLFNPFYFPYDSQAKKSLNYNGKKYNDFYIEVEKYINKNKENIIKYLGTVNNLSKVIESNFIDEFTSSEIKLIRKNRFIDKMLWTQED